jgi:hypothetical protein
LNQKLKQKKNNSINKSTAEQKEQVTQNTEPKSQKRESSNKITEPSIQKNQQIK